MHRPNMALPDKIFSARGGFSSGCRPATHSPVFPGSKPADFPRRIDEKLRSISSSTFGAQPVDPAVQKTQLTRVEIAVGGLDCRACSLAVYEIVVKVDGVYQATASFHEGNEAE